MTATPLPPYSGEDVTCPMCGHEGASTRFLPHGTCSHAGASSLNIGWHPNERLHRACLNCSYDWDEQTIEQTCAALDHYPEDCGHCEKRGERP
jgi:hypothetical protein